MAFLSPPPKYSFHHKDFQSPEWIALLPHTWLKTPEKEWNYYGNNMPFLVAKLDDNVWTITDGTGDDWTREGNREKITKEMSCILYGEIYTRKAGESWDYNKKHDIVSTCRKQFNLIK